MVLVTYNKHIIAFTLQIKKERIKFRKESRSELLSLPYTPEILLPILAKTINHSLVI